MTHLPSVVPKQCREKCAFSTYLRYLITHGILRSMDSTLDLAPNAHGRQLTVAKRNVLISKMIDHMVEGYTSTHSLAKKLRVDRRTIDRYKPFADEIIAKSKFDRNAIRALQIRRTYTIIESLMNELNDLNKTYLRLDEHGKKVHYKSSSVKERVAIYGQIFKFSSHLALITGLNVETQVHVDAKKLVIVRSSTADAVANERDDVPHSDVIDVTPVNQPATP